ncbi:MAG TPA: SigE family RNA polymerase sigma factor [Actinomycetota bacterium]|nr:SigE family RNA polymerase sigma factor [Actinomycetota bacterium]
MKATGLAEEQATSMDEGAPSSPDCPDCPDFPAFCAAHYADLVATLSFVLHDRWQAEDVAQEALARAWARWRRVGGLERPDLWLRRVAINLAISTLRRRRVAARYTRSLSDGAAPGPDRDPDDTVAQALASLSPRRRTAVVLRYFADLSVADTAVAMGCKEGTVKALTSQAIAALRHTINLDEEA